MNENLKRYIEDGDVLIGRDGILYVVRKTHEDDQELLIEDRYFSGKRCINLTAYKDDLTFMDSTNNSTFDIVEHWRAKTEDDKRNVQWAGRFNKENWDLLFRKESPKTTVVVKLISGDKEISRVVGIKTECDDVKVKLEFYRRGEKYEGITYPDELEKEIIESLKFRGWTPPEGEDDAI